MRVIDKIIIHCSATVEEKLSILKAMEVFRIVIETIRERKEVKNEVD